MPHFSDHRPDQVLLLALLGLLLFASPLVHWWSAAGRIWYVPYLLWLFVILLGLWLQVRRSRHEQ